MEAQLWTLIGLLAATPLGLLIYLGPKINRLETRIDGLSAHIDELGVKLDDHLRRHAS
jgi:hypothetical protein